MSPFDHLLMPVAEAPAPTDGILLVLGIPVLLACLAIVGCCVWVSSTAVRYAKGEHGTDAQRLGARRQQPMKQEANPGVRFFYTMMTIMIVLPVLLAVALVGEVK